MNQMNKTNKMNKWVDHDWIKQIKLNKSIKNEGKYKINERKKV